MTRSDGQARWGKWLIILPPLLFLLVFFLIPFGFALSISFADTAVRVPPFTDILSRSPDWHIHLTLNLGNFKYLLTDEVYGLSYLYSLKTAFFSTIICLLLGYPMAYGIARTSKSTQSILLLIIILPFWTSFLLRESSTPICPPGSYPCSRPSRSWIIPCSRRPAISAARRGGPSSK